MHRRCAELRSASINATTVASALALALSLVFASSDAALTLALVAAASKPAGATTKQPAAFRITATTVITATDTGIVSAATATEAARASLQGRRQLPRPRLGL